MLLLELEEEEESPGREVIANIAAREFSVSSFTSLSAGCAGACAEWGEVL